MSLSEKVKSLVRDIPDFPKKGIVFKDITPIIENPQVSREVVAFMADQFTGDNVDAVIGIESRGFIFGSMLAQQMNVPFVLVRKKGKLPYKTVSHAYELEYGSAEVEMHTDSIKPGWNVLIHDDLLATGGTAEAAAKLVLKQNASVAGFAFVMALGFLNGVQKLKPICPKIVNIAEF